MWKTSSCRKNAYLQCYLTETLPVKCQQQVNILTCALAAAVTSLFKFAKVVSRVSDLAAAVLGGGGMLPDPWTVALAQVGGGT